MQLLAPGSSKADVDGRPELVSPLRCSLVARGVDAVRPPPHQCSANTLSTTA